MSIDKLTSSASLHAALASAAGQKIQNKAGTLAKTPGSENHKSKSIHNVNVLRAQLADLVNEVSLEDAEAIKRIRPQVYRAILLWEFGAELREHADWQLFLERIDFAIENQPEQNEKLMRLLKELKT